MMLPSLVSILVLVTLPDPGSIETLTAGQSATVRPGSDGYGWIRILEDDYVCLEITAEPRSGVSVYDASGELLLSASRDQTASVSAFSDYWFYVRVEPDGAGPVDLSVREEAPGIIRSGGATGGSVPGYSMATAFTFVPSSSGRWQIER